MFGINGAELGILLLVAVIVVGPERLPGYAEQLGGWVRTLRSLLRTAKDRVTEELGDDVKDVDWASLDPRRYDPRRIVREALFDELKPVVPAAVATGRRYTTGAARRASEVSARPVPVAPDGPAPYDDEAT